MQRRRLTLFTLQFLTNNPLRLHPTIPSLHRPLSTYTSFRRPPPDPNDPSTLLKEDGFSLYSQMWIDNFRNPDKVLTNLSSFLRRFELWLLAYQKVCTDETGSYTPQSSIQRPQLEDLLALRNAVIDGNFKWGARLKLFIKSPIDKTDYDSLSKRKIRIILTTTQPSPFQENDSGMNAAQM